MAAGASDPITAGIDLAKEYVKQIGTFFNNLQQNAQARLVAQQNVGYSQQQYDEQTQLNSQTIFGKALDEQAAAQRTQMIVIIAVLLFLGVMFFFLLKYFKK